MSRSKKKPDVTALEHIPAVRDALRAVGLEMLIRPIGQPLVALGQTTTAQPPPPPVLAPSARDAWLAQTDEVSQAIQAEQTRGAPAPSRPAAQLPAAQRRAVEKGFLQDAAANRATKLAQFTHEVAEPGAAMVETEELTTLAEAT